MALIQCTDCGTKVSDAAAACPNCARPVSARKKRTGEAALSVVIGLGLSWLCASSIYLFFPYDTGIIGGTLLISGVVLFARQSG